MPASNKLILLCSCARLIFPVCRSLPATGKPELKQHLQKFSARPYSERLADFHLLLYLARQPNFDLSGEPPMATMHLATPPFMAQLCGAGYTSCCMHDAASICF